MRLNKSKIWFFTCYLILAIVLFFCSDSTKDTERFKQFEDTILRAYFVNQNIQPQKTASGLYHLTLKKSQNPILKAEEFVSIEYTGRVLYGQVFDSTEFSGKPIRVQVGSGKIFIKTTGTKTTNNGKVIIGWREAISLMRLGEKKRVFIPSHLAYGNRSVGNLIPPNAILIFDMEIIKK